MHLIERIRKNRTLSLMRKRYADMRISLKLALSYTFAAAFFIVILGTFYYHHTKSYIETQMAAMLRETMKQTKDNIDYKVNLYNRLADTIYVNANLQELLYNEYIHPSDRLEPQRNILGYIQPLRNSYKDINELSLIVSNYTIPPFHSSIVSERSVKMEAWYQMIVPRNDSILWTLDSQIGALSLSKGLKHLIYDSSLGIVFIQLDSGRFFGGLKETGIDSKGWFDITDGDGQIVYSGSSNGRTALKEGMHNQYRNGFLTDWDRNVPITLRKQGLMALHDVIEYTGWSIVYVIPMDTYQEAIRKLQFTTVSAIFLCVCFFIGISILLASGLTRRIRQLSHSMESIQIGNFDVQIPHATNDEIGSLAVGFNTMAGELKKLVEEVYTIQIKEKESELKALQAQINPHFLYNTLASISWLGMRNGSDDITQISNALARFYKLSLSKGSNIIKVQDEIEHIKAYMYIQSIRFKNRIHMIYEIDEQVLEYQTLKLILQPFVENALVHGMWKDKKNITIKLVIKREESLLISKIIDDGVGISKEKLNQLLFPEDNDAAGYGIINVDQRLKLFYGDRYGVSVFSKRGVGTVITITTPVK